MRAANLAALGLLALVPAFFSCALPPDTIALRGGWYEIGGGNGTIRAYFDPGSCSGSCGDEFEQFLKDVHATDGAFQMSGFLVGEIPFELDGAAESDDPELHGLTIDCSTDLTGVGAAWCGPDAPCAGDLSIRFAPDLSMPREPSPRQTAISRRQVSHA